MSEKIKKALRIAVNVGCGFEGDAEDAVSLLGLIEANEARIAELEKENNMLKQLSQPIEFWSDEKMQMYKNNERRTERSGNREVQE